MFRKSVKLSTILLSILCLCFALFTSVFAASKQATQVSTSVTFTPGLLFQVYAHLDNSPTGMLIFDNSSPTPPTLDHSYFSPNTPTTNLSSKNQITFRTVNCNESKTIRTKVFLTNANPSPVYLDENLVMSNPISPGAADNTNSFHIVSLFNGSQANLVINVKEVVLPSEYQELEYLESNGAQYIDTQVPLLDNINFEIVGNFTAASKANVMGALGAAGSNHWAVMCGLSPSNNGFIYGWGILATQYTSSYDLDKHTWRKQEMSYYIDDTFITTCQPTSNQRNAFLFDVNGYSSPNCACMFRLNSCKMWDNDILVRDFVTAKRTADGVSGLYDVENDVFYTNANTSASATPFIAGPHN